MKQLIGLFALLFLFIGCKKDVEQNFTLQKSRLKKSFFETQKTLLERVNVKVENYQDDVNFFNNLPAQFALEDCQMTWKSLYNEFLILSPYRYFSGNLDAGFKQNQNNFDLSSINYEYIDYSVNQPNGGIVSDTINYPTINQVNLISWHQVGGEKNVTLGFHAAEFLLWGEDLSLSAPGMRTNIDYQQINTVNKRRKDFFVETSTLLTSMIKEVKNDAVYKASLLSMNEDEAFAAILKGYMRFIKEDLVNRTLLKPLGSLDAKDELSDFSDNTIENIKSKLKGLRLALDGSELFAVSEESWYFMIDFITDVDEVAAKEIISSLDNAEGLINQINVDFDQALQNPMMREKLKNIAVELNNIHAVLERIVAENTTVG
ncbi:hypothetical protein ERX46_14720 [Brumimicrobium glaciale]|uniref:Imelysin-like domain-containing protein n=1 Tax=Brumimicrobium glaciale TaxID=200475 RepID=A0A4Q4KH71_9FLAO|nr:imelysin family protein [Brumimicrobium glaciale]RYM32522.1 hypothetical protein ERX46_14720 [Brumimicrobium glaciale]